jgi:glutamate-1-semialdehyde 2,1-aminomutase
MPVGAFGGKQEIMEHIAPLGNVYQAGTLSGNPIAMIAGYTLLKTLNENPSIYAELEEKTSYLSSGLNKVLKQFQISYMINQVGSMISVHFSKEPVVDFATSASSDIKFFNKFFHCMLKRGVYLPPSSFESWFVCNALTKEDIDYTISAASDSLKEISAQ